MTYLISNTIIAILILLVNEIFSCFASWGLYLRFGFELVKNFVDVVNILHQSVGFCCGYSAFFVREELPSWILGFQGLVSIVLLIRARINLPHSPLALFEFNFCVLSWRMRELEEAMSRKRVEEPWKKNERAYVLDISCRITKCEILCW